MEGWVWLVAVLLAGAVEEGEASYGDRSWVYRSCGGKCVEENCTEDAAKLKPDVGLLVWLLQPLQVLPEWTCKDECKYMCMWKTVSRFLEEGYSVPQFHGKWPFVRVMGLQEPASAFFSLLNLCAHGFGLAAFRRRVPIRAPMSVAVHLFAAVCMHAWLWSCVFHSRDTPFTEAMDYTCAFSVVLSSLLLLFLRLGWSGPETMLGARRRWGAASLLICLALFAHHVLHVMQESFDYGYNMKMSIAVGSINGIGWLVWWWMCRRAFPYAWKAATFVVLLAATMLLEVADFPPLLWTLDAHALWHLSTIPLPALWYNFLADDSQMLQDMSIGWGKKV